MKAVKIILVVLVFFGMGVVVFWGMGDTKTPPPVVAKENQFIKKIEQQIKKVESTPNTKFCIDLYDETTSQIKEFYEQGRFDKAQEQNTQWKESLENSLYAVYVDKFFSQVNNVFRNTEWDVGDVRIIQKEKNKLKQSKLLERGSEADNTLGNIQVVLNKYYEIVSFIAESHNFSYNEKSLSSSFPIYKVENKLFKAKVLLRDGLENSCLRNCTRLKKSLQELPEFLFKKHVSYLDNKINYWSGMYSNYATQGDYYKNLYKPLKAEIGKLDNNVYHVSNFDSDYYRLLKKWNDDNVKAYKYSY